MEIEECDPRENLERIKEVKEVTLKDSGAYAEKEPEPDYSEFEYFLVGKLDGKIIATGGIKEPGRISEDIDKEDSTLEIKNMYVLPEHQRQGFGSQILKNLEDEAKNKNCDRMVLETAKVQRKALNFYKERGFEKIGEKGIKYGNTRLELIFLSKNLFSNA
jgi:ribosomal protein S18 acetylase RimI-like enzyme